MTTTFAPPRPSPAHDAVTLEYTLAAPATVTLAMHDLAGRRVRGLEQGRMHGPGLHSARWDGASDDGRPAPAGLYFARLETGSGVLVRRIVWIP